MNPRDQLYRGGVAVASEGPSKQLRRRWLARPNAHQPRGFDARSAAGTD